MAAAIWHVRRNMERPGPTVNGIHSAIINRDDAQTEAQVLVTAATQMATATGAAVPSDYFDEADIAIASGQLDAASDAVFYANRGRTNLIA
jgi:hypothetical protein